MIIVTNSAEETKKLAMDMAGKMTGGNVITLIGDLGVGKTVFAQGFAEGLGIEEPVSSPTFTIRKDYDDGRIPLYHFDAYRIGDVDEMEEIGYEDCFYGDGVSLVEWANLIEDILPEHYTKVTISKVPGDFDKREINIEEI